MGTAKHGIKAGKELAFIFFAYYIAYWQLTNERGNMETITKPLTVLQAARELGIAEQTVRNWITDGKLTRDETQLKLAIIVDAKYREALAERTKE